MERLSDLTVSTLPASVIQPGYDRTRLGSGIVHLGVGAFHRAHQAAMTEAVLASGDLDWGITAASLRSPDTRDALAPQDGLYTLVIRDGEAERLQVIGAIREVIVAPEDPERLIRAMADPAVRIVTLTITEKGYCHDPATGALNEAHPDIVHDLSDMRAPRSAPGYLLAALARRRVRGIAPFTVVSCDNLPSNGRTLHRVLSRMASLLEPAFGKYVREQVSCPCTMVDRIAPATTDADRAAISAALGVSDAWPVVTEPFSQWVIEDRFPTGRPAWEIAGATFADDVAPFELMKLRLLNGAHSALAYLGSQMGLETVADAAADPDLARYLAGFWAEMRPAVPAPPGVDTRAYCDQLMARFANPTIRHKLLQIAMDGSQKLPQRWLKTLAETRAAGRPVRHLVLALAGFALHASGTDARGEPVTVRDPLADEMARRLAGLRADPDAAIARFLGLAALFGPGADGDAALRRALSDAVRELLAGGVRPALARLAAGA